MLFYDINTLEIVHKIEECGRILSFKNNILTSLDCEKFEEWEIKNFELEKISEYNIKENLKQYGNNFIKTKRGNIIVYINGYGNVEDGIYVYKIIK